MAIPSIKAFQKSVYEALKANATLMAMVGGIFDHVPQGSDYPYIVFGESNEKSWFNRERLGSEQMLTLVVFSRGRGRKECLEIMEKIHATLHQVSLTVEAQLLISIRYHSSRVALEDDGATYKGLIQFRAILQES